MADGRTALSQHRRRPPARRPRRRRVGVFLATAVIATVTVCAAGFVMIVYGPAGSSPDPLAVAVAQGVTGKSATLLENERQQIILEDADSQKFTVTSEPTITSQPASTSTSTGDTTTGAPIVDSGPPPNPSSAQGIAYKLLPSYGFSTDQVGCLHH